jgi:malate dehydrogenase (oxaloacetate-decarboxylating)
MLLERYRERLLSFNDDIQGTGAVGLAALLTAMRIKRQRFSDQRFVIAGMGQAGTGIASNIRTMLLEEGVSEEEARSRLFAFDVPGLLVDDMKGLTPAQEQFAQRRSRLAGWNLEKAGTVSLMDVVRNAKATVLIGVTAAKGLFNAPILTQMAANDERPVIFALSNPTSKSECTPEEVARATKGKALAATGSPFPPLEFGGKTIVTSQCNNMFIFPGMGLGALVSRTPRITTNMFLRGSRAISGMVTGDQCAAGKLLPDLADIRSVSATVAKAVALEARDAGLGRILDDGELDKLIARAQWKPHYASFRPGSPGGGD